MCGIVGFVNYKRDLQNKKEVLNKMIQTISRRGPDEDGIYTSENIGLGHKRLIVIDKEGRQTANGRKIFCRRIYNNL